jgi:hypothetical protein
METDQKAFVDKASFLPFKQPSELMISSRLPLEHNHIFDMLLSFSNLESLSIVNKKPISIPAVDLSALLPQLKVLKFIIDTFPVGFELTNLLPRTLEHLYVRQKTESSHPLLVSKVELPNLHTLGVMFPGSAILENLTNTSLR